MLTAGSPPIILGAKNASLFAEPFYMKTIILPRQAQDTSQV